MLVGLAVQHQFDPMIDEVADAATGGLGHDALLQPGLRRPTEVCTLIASGELSFEGQYG